MNTRNGPFVPTSIAGEVRVTSDVPSMLGALNAQSPGASTPRFHPVASGASVCRSVCQPDPVSIVSFAPVLSRLALPDRSGGENDSGAFRSPLETVALMWNVWNVADCAICTGTRTWPTASGATEGSGNEAPDGNDTRGFELAT